MGSYWFSTARLLWSFLWFWLSANYSLPLFFPGGLYWISALNVIISAVLGCLFLFTWLSKPFKLRSTIAKWIFLYLGWVGFASLLSPYFWDNWLRSAGFFASTASLVTAMLFGSRLVDANYAFIGAGRAYVFGAILTTASLILLGAEKSARFGNDELLHPNSLGFLYGTTLCFLIFFPLPRIWLVRLSMATVFVLLLAITFSKTSIIAMLLAVSVAAVFQRGWSKANYVLRPLVIGGTAFLLTQEYVQQQLQVYTSNPYLVQTLSGRTIIWSWTLDMVRERPWLGYGFATFRDIFWHAGLLGFTIPIVHAHNAYLDALFTGGFLGLSLFLLCVFFAVRAIVHTAKRLKGTYLSSLFVSITTFILVRSLAEGALNLGRDFWILTAVALLAERWAVKAGGRFYTVNTSYYKQRK